jgi:hypothetical protein
MPGASKTTTVTVTVKTGAGSTARHTTDLKFPAKADGSRDKRYTAPQFVKADGTRDMRTKPTSKR